MTAFLIFIAVVLGVIALAVLYVIAIYNGLITKKNRMKAAWGQVGVHLHKRHDTIPNLVTIASKYMEYEKDTLTAVIDARSRAVGATTPEQAIAAEKGLTGALGKLLAISERYPDLKASSQMSAITEELKSCEATLAFARQHYNDMVATYNIGRETFPANIIAGTFNFEPGVLFDVENESVREAIKVKFD